MIAARGSLLVAALTLSVATPAIAQSTSVSANTDSAASAGHSRTAKKPGFACLGGGPDMPLVPLLVFPFVAPSFLLGFTCGETAHPPPSAISHAEISFTQLVVGDTGTTGGRSIAFEWTHEGSYVEASLAEWNAAGTLDYERVRVGRVIHPYPEFWGGFTLGYQRSRHDPTQEGIELGLPFVVMDGRSRWRSEAMYVASSHRVNINYRFRWDRQLGAGPLRSGLDLDVKRIRRGGPVTAGVSLVLSWRR